MIQNVFGAMANRTFYTNLGYCMNRGIAAYPGWDDAFGGCVNRNYNVATYATIVRER
jgi:hypothetical protein